MRCKVGDKALVIRSIDGAAVGAVVEVCSYQGEHSVYGPIWRVRSLGRPLATEYGALSLTVDMADSWLDPQRPEEKRAEIRELEAA